MKINYNQFFKLAKDKGIEESELKYTSNSSFECSIFSHDIDSYSASSTSSLTARGIYNNVMGFSTTNDINKDSFDYLVNSIIESSKYIEKNDDTIIFKGSKKYKKVHTFNKDLENISKDEKIKKLFDIENKLYEFDSRIQNVIVGYSETSKESQIANSYGLKLKSKTNYYQIYAQVTAKDNDQVVSEGDMFIDNDFSKFDIDKWCDELASKAIKKLNPIQVKSGKYKVLLNQDTVATLINKLLTSTSSEEIQKGSSILINKLNQQIASKKLTVYEKPLEKNIFARSFDDEGVATYNKELIKNGVLKTYLYNLTTAKKDNVESTGNGYMSGPKIGISFTNVIIKPGRQSFDETVSKIKKGIYITEISGIHAGLNSQSGEFNLQSQGYLIEDGKITKPLSLIVLSGNLFEMFNNIATICSDSKDILDTRVPSILIKKLSVSGK